jgi:hypothetical protein
MVLKWAKLTFKRQFKPHIITPLKNRNIPRPVNRNCVLPFCNHGTEEQCSIIYTLQNTAYSQSQEICCIITGIQEHSSYSFATVSYPPLR